MVSWSVVLQFKVRQPGTFFMINVFDGSRN